jgi:hypothetical protein
MSLLFKLNSFTFSNRVHSDIGGIDMKKGETDFIEAVTN